MCEWYVNDQNAHETLKQNKFVIENVHWTEAKLVNNKHKLNKEG